MDYKINIVERSVDEDAAYEVFQALLKRIAEGKNYDPTKGLPASTEGHSIVLTDNSWGAKRPVNEDMEGFSAEYPELTFQFIQASSVLNGTHFENLANYSMSIYKDGRLLEILKPEPIVWKSVEQVQYLATPWD